MKATEYRKKSKDELENELLALKKEQFNMRMQRGIEQNAQTHLQKAARRKIARIKTILSEKEGS